MSRPGSRPQDVPRPAWRSDPVLAGRPDLARPRLRGASLGGRVVAAVSGVALLVLALGQGAVRAWLVDGDEGGSVRPRWSQHGVVADLSPGTGAALVVGALALLLVASLLTGLLVGRGPRVVWIRRETGQPMHTGRGSVPAGTTSVDQVRERLEAGDLGSLADRHGSGGGQDVVVTTHVDAPAAVVLVSIRGRRDTERPALLTLEGPEVVRTALAPPRR